MLRKKQEYKYLKKRWLAMLSHVIRFAESHDPEELHKMRVEVKKIKAALTLSAIPLKKRKLNPLQKLFRDAGAVRDTQVSLALLEQWYPENQVSKNEQNELMLNRSDAFYLKTATYVKNNLQLFKVVAKRLHAAKNRYLVKWYNKQLKEVDHLFEDPQVEQNLHLCRKKIKTILYGYSLIKNKLENKLPVNTSYLDRLQEKIGQWHDTVLTLEFLAAQQSLNKPVVAKLNRLKKRQVRSLVSLSADFKCKAVTLAKDRKIGGVKHLSTQQAGGF